MMVFYIIKFYCHSYCRGKVSTYVCMYLLHIYPIVNYYLAWLTSAEFDHENDNMHERDIGAVGCPIEVNEEDASTRNCSLQPS